MTQLALDYAVSAVATAPDGGATALLLIPAFLALVGVSRRTKRLRPAIG